MKILYDDNMPYGEAFFADLGECQAFSHQTLSRQALQEADILLVRSTTRVDGALLDACPHLKFVSTATAGTNHLDVTALESRQIPYASAAGCNAIAVAEYVISALFALAAKNQWVLSTKTVGIVGAGHVGSALADKLTALGIAFKLCDPPLAEKGDTRQFVDMDAIMTCDVISLHTPLITGGRYPTLHMFDRERLMALAPEQVLINACRGEVVDTQSARQLIRQGRKMSLVLDVWENEPDIDTELVPLVQLATQHIAGHTLEGKARGTEILYQQVCQIMGGTPDKSLAQFLPQPEVPVLSLDSHLPTQQMIQNLIHQVYDVRLDDQRFRQHIREPGWFAYSRKHYAIRREFSAFAVSAGNCPASEAIYGLGFRRC